MNNPENLLYAESHEWLRIEGKEAVIGITDFAQHSLGDITFVDVPQVGDTFTKGQEMGAVESVKAASEIYMPLACKVIAVNENLEDIPELINAEPYGKGWILRVSFTEEPQGLLTAQQYAEKCEK